MNTEEIFTETGRLGNKIKEHHRALDLINERCFKLMDICPHELVFKYNDKKPRKMIMDGYYFCPACGRTIQLINKEDIKISPYKNSRIINLSNLSLTGIKETYSKIRHEVYYNMDFYYNNETTDYEIQDKMEKVLKDKEKENKPKSFVLKKDKKMD